FPQFEGNIKRELQVPRPRSRVSGPFRRDRSSPQTAGVRSFLSPSYVGPYNNPHGRRRDCTIQHQHFAVGRRAAQMAKYSEPIPTPFLEVRLHDLAANPGLTGLCAGYESREWRAKQLAAHLIEWLPEFALTRKEIANIGPHNLVRILTRAAQV